MTCQKTGHISSNEKIKLNKKYSYSINSGPVLNNTKIFYRHDFTRLVHRSEKYIITKVYGRLFFANLIILFHTKPTK